jgi:hypothetical protein
MIFRAPYGIGLFNHAYKIARNGRYGLRKIKRGEKKIKNLQTQLLHCVAGKI